MADQVGEVPDIEEQEQAAVVAADPDDSNVIVVQESSSSGLKRGSLWFIIIVPMILLVIVMFLVAIFIPSSTSATKPSDDTISATKFVVYPGYDTTENASFDTSGEVTVTFSHGTTHTFIRYDLSAGRIMPMAGKMYGLKFTENWYTLGESNGGNANNIPPFELVAYKGHTLQGNYEGVFVYAKEPILPYAAIPATTGWCQRGGSVRVSSAQGGNKD
jgi:hypothetical protein